MGWKGGLISIVLHGVVIVTISATASEKRAARAPTTVTVRKTEKKKEEEKKKPEESPPPKPPPPKRVAAPVAPPPSKEPAKPPPVATPVHNVVDLGLMMSSDAPSGVGVAVPVGPRGDAAKAAGGAEAEKPKPVPVAARKRIDKEQECTEAPSKPEPLDKIEIEYPMSAREAGVEGRLVLRVYVAPDGSVERVEVLSGLGELVDPVAISVVKRWRFTPAKACAKAVAGVYTLARRFELGD